MYDLTVSNSIALKLKTVRILWFALITTVVLYDFLLIYMRKTDEHVREVPPHLAEILSAIALGVGVTSIVFPRKVFADNVRRMEIAVAEEPGEAIGGFRESAPVRRVVAKPAEAVSSAFAPFQTPWLLGMALCESIALFGLVLGYLGENMLVASAFFLVALVLMASKYPRVSTIIGAIERVTGATCTL